MHIAVVIPAFNVADFLSEAISSVLAQTYADWSMVVVDDGSTDATAAVAASFWDRRIRLIRQRNSGVSAARNVGVAIAASRRDPPDAYLFLDGDDWLEPNALALLANALDRAPGAIASVGRFARVGLDGTVRTAPCPPQGDLLEPLLTRNLFANGGHLLIRRAAVEAAGDFRTGLSYGEDWEYWTRLALLGHFVSVPAPVLFVRERLGSAYLSRATDPAAYRPAMQAIYSNPDLTRRLEPTRIAALAQQAEAEMAWTVGRELIRHGRRQDGRRWLGQSLRCAPSPRRLALLVLSWLRLGPFRSYRTVDAATA
jgi:glycosyltransferase involved in cell wall biosynthesis